jgi:type IV pilus biogenesis protein CpaD/CtpE
MRRIAPTLRATFVLLPLFAAGCADIDPYMASYRWQPEGAPQANFANQLADPLDLVRGRGPDAGTPGDGARAAAAIAKWNKEGPGGAKSLEGAAGSLSAGGGS